MSFFGSFVNILVPDLMLYCICLKQSKLIKSGDPGGVVMYNNSCGSTSLSNLFIDDFMKDANDAQIKVYLYLLRMMNAGKNTSITDIADKFNHTEKDVLRSLGYWEKRGLITLEFDSEHNLTGIYMKELRDEELHDEKTNSRVISVAPMLQRSSGRQIGTTVAASGANVQPSISKPAKQVRSAEALAAFKADRKRRELLFIIEQYVGKPLSVNEIRTVAYISEDLHFSDDLIDYLFQYCVDRGKKDFRYIEKVAVNWAENGVSTTVQAKENVAGRKPASTQGKNPFSQFKQNNYDFNELKDILDN